MSADRRPVSLARRQAAAGLPVSRRAVFLDRDGVINRNRADYVLSPEQVEYLPGAFDALRRLATSDFQIVIITNQSPVGRGLMSLETMQGIMEAIIGRIQAEGGRVDAAYACPHRPDEGCVCRKPRPGMLLQAAADLGVDLHNSFLVGDAASDVEAGLAAGCSPFLVRTGRGQAQAVLLQERGHAAVPVVADLGEAVARILGTEQPE